MKWKYHLSKVTSTFVTGYGSGLALIFGFTELHTEGTNWYNLLFYPMIAGFIVLIPYLGIIIGEYSDGLKKNSK